MYPPIASTFLTAFSIDTTFSFNLSSEDANATMSFVANIAPTTPDGAVPTPIPFVVILPD